MSGEFDKPAAHLVADSEETYGWGNLTLAVQLLLPLALVALLFAKKRVWIYPYPLLDSYISALCPSFSQQQRLLKWMSSRIPHMNSLPNKIAQYWQNGSLLCTLINTVVPGACPNPQKHWKKPPIHGQALAYKYLGVAPILSDKDFSKPSLNSYSERKFIKYLLSLQDAINKATIEEDTLKFTSKYVARGMGLVIGEQNRPSTFYIYPNTGSNKIEDILVNIKGPYNTFGGHAISTSKASEEINKLAKIGKDAVDEQRKLEYKSPAQRSFFRSVSFDIGPIMNLVSNGRNSGEISVEVEMEEERAKVTFLPKFSGIYELLLTNDGQHLQGSPFIARVMKNTKEVEDVLQAKAKLTKGKIERKIIGKRIDFISESVEVTDEFCLKLDSNNNTSGRDESNKSDDESAYQDSGVFDLSEQNTNRSRQNEYMESTDESNQNSLECKNAEDNVSHMIEFENELFAQTQKIIVHNQTPNDIEFLTEDYAQQTDVIDGEIMAENNIAPLKEEEDLSENHNQRLGEDIFDNIELQNNQDFENLYNKYADNERYETFKETHQQKENQNKNHEQTSTINDTDPGQNINRTDFEILSNIPQFQKGRKITASSIEKIVEIFEKDKNVVHLTVAERTTPQKPDITDASPVLSDIAQEANDVLEQSRKEDSARLEGDGQLSSRERRSNLNKHYSICLDEEETYDTNVKEIKNIFEKKQETGAKVHGRRFATKRQDGLQESKRMLAKSLPNLVCDAGKGSEGRSYAEDEFLARFKQKRDFWNNLILKNSTSSLNVSSSEIAETRTKSMTKYYENVSQSSNSLNTFEKNKSSTINKYKRKKELCKTTSLDLSKSCDDISTQDKDRKVTRAESLYDRIRLFDTGFDSDKHNTLLKRTKERSNLKEKPSQLDVQKPESLSEVPNTTSTNQIEEDIRFAEIMKERFEISRRYFCSLESLHAKASLSRRHSMDSKSSAPKDVPLQKGGSLKVLNVVDKFSLDNIYKDVVLSKMRNSNFRGSPNRDAVVETLSSVSSNENESDKRDNKDYAEEEDLNMQFFNIRKRLRKRRSIKSIFDVNY